MALQQVSVAKVRLREGLLERPDIAAAWGDLVDAVAGVVRERDVRTGEQVVTLVEGPGVEQRAGDAGVPMLSRMRFCMGSLPWWSSPGGCRTLS
jgi:hypothetical protein